MNKYKILFSADSIEDITEITKYLKEMYVSPKLSKRYHNELFETIRSLEIMPNRFETVRMKYIKRNDIRKIAYKQYLIFYVVNDEKKEVYILRVRHGKTDWKDSNHTD